MLPAVRAKAFQQGAAALVDRDDGSIRTAGVGPHGDAGAIFRLRLQGRAVEAYTIAFSQNAITGLAFTVDPVAAGARAPQAVAGLRDGMESRACAAVLNVQRRGISGLFDHRPGRKRQRIRRACQALAGKRCSGDGNFQPEIIGECIKRGV